MKGPLNCPMSDDPAKRYQTHRFYGGISGITGKRLPDLWVTVDSYQVWRDRVRTIDQTVGAQYPTRGLQRNQTAEYNASNRLTSIEVAYFKAERNEVFAVFPGQHWGRHGNIAAYFRVGQHGEASIDYIRECRPASSRQYRELHREIRRLTIRYDKRDLRIIDPIEYLESL